MRHQRIKKVEVDKFFRWYQESESDDEHLVGKYEGEEVLMNLLNYKVFKHKGTDCPICKAKGAFFALERTPGRGRNKYNKWHFNLYAIDPFGREVLMTKDHTLAKSVGGTDDLENLEPMCQSCNSRKGSIPVEVFMERVRGRVTETEWELTCFNRAAVSTKKIYGIELTASEFVSIKKAAASAPVVFKDGTISIRQINKFGKDMLIEWESAKNLVLDVVDHTQREAYFRKMPDALAEMQAEAEKLFDQILDSAIKELEGIHESDMGMERFKKFKFPSLLDNLHKGNEVRLKSTVRNIVISKLKNGKRRKTKKGAGPAK